MVAEREFCLDEVSIPISDKLTIPIVFMKVLMPVDNYQYYFVDTEAEFERCLSLIETILADRFPNLTQEMILQILDLKQMDITQSRFYQEISEEARQEGHQEGLQKGLQEGRQEEALNFVLRLLKRRLGDLSASQVEQVQGLSVSQLEDLEEALLDFSTMADLHSYLAKSV